jgi:bacterioferritin
VFTEYTVGDTLESMIREGPVAKRIAIDSYGQMLSYLGARDPLTRRLMQEILAREQAHVEDLASLLQDVSFGAGHSARS